MIFILLKKKDYNKNLVDKFYRVNNSLNMINTKKRLNFKNYTEDNKLKIDSVQKIMLTVRFELTRTYAQWILSPPP